MTRNVKTIPEKIIDVEKIISNILKINRIEVGDFLYKTGISLDAYRKMVERGNLSKGAVKSILAKFDVNEGYLMGDEDFTLSGKLTGVQDEAAIPQKPLGDFVVPQQVLHDRYEIVPKALFDWVMAELVRFQQDAVVKKTKKHA